MTVQLVAYDRDNAVQVGVLTTARRIVFSTRLNSRGALTFVWTPALDGAPTTAVDPHRWIRVRDAGVDLAAYRVESPTKVRSDSTPAATAADVSVSAVGALAAGDGITVFPQGGIGFDYGTQSATRWFGFMSDTYDDSGWDAVYPIHDGPTTAKVPRDTWDTFAGNLHDDWPDPRARYCWAYEPAANQDPDPYDSSQFPTGVVYFRRRFTVTYARQVLLAVSANDEFELYLDGALIASGDHPTSRDETQLQYLTLTAGTHTLAARVENIDTIGTGRRPAWFLCSVLAAPNATLDGTDQVDELVRDAGVNDGTFTMTVDGDTTAPIPWDASPDAIRSALTQAMFPRQLFVFKPLRPADGDLDVAGSGVAATPWTVSWTGWRTARRTHTVTVNSAGLVGGSITVTNVATATPPEQLVTVDADWSCLPYPADDPGVTVGEVVLDLLTEAAARTAGPGIAGTNITAALDSAGVAWPGPIQIGLPVGRTLEQALGTLVDLEADIDVSPAGIVRVWGRRGADRTATFTLEAGTPTATATGTHALQAPVADRLLVGHATGFTQADQTGATGKRREAFLSVGTVASDAAAVDYALGALRDLSADRDTSTFVVPAESFAAIVGADIGDVITATGWNATTLPQRIVAIDGLVDDGAGTLTWTVVAVANLSVRRGHDQLDAADATDRIVQALGLMADGTVGGRIRTATPVRYVPVVPARGIRQPAPPPPPPPDDPIIDVGNAEPFNIPLDVGRFMGLLNDGSNKMGIFSITDLGVVALLTAVTYAVEPSFLGSLSYCQTGINRWVVFSNDRRQPMIIGCEYLPGSNTVTQSVGTYTPTFNEVTIARGTAHATRDPVSDTVLSCQEHRYGAGVVTPAANNTMVLSQIRWQDADTVPSMIVEQRRLTTGAPGSISAGVPIIRPDGTGKYHAIFRATLTANHTYLLLNADGTLVSSGTLTEMGAIAFYTQSVFPRTGGVFFSSPAPDGLSITLHHVTYANVRTDVATFPTPAGNPWNVNPFPSDTRPFWQVADEFTGPKYLFDANDMITPILSFPADQYVFFRKWLSASEPILTATRRWHSVGWFENSTPETRLVQLIGEPL